MNEIIERLKELTNAVAETLDKDFGFWSSPSQAERRARLWPAYITARALLSTLTNLTPSGVERITDEMVKAGAKAIMGCNGGFTSWQFWREDARACLTAALALPSEPPSQGDVEGRARELLAGEYARLGFAEAADCVQRGKPAGWLTEDVAIPAIVKALASKEDGRS